MRRRMSETNNRPRTIMPKPAQTKTTSKILIADDNLQNCELLDAYLADEGYEISFAYDGQQTLDQVAKSQPDLILLDIMMPKVSGYEVCQKLKQGDQTANIPVLVVTALNEQGDIEKAVEAGCDDFLTKPVNQIELKTRVRSLLRVRHLTNERDRLLSYLAEVEGMHRQQP
jgi:CheY-like chemotaxis protein